MNATLKFISTFLVTAFVALLSLCSDVSAQEIRAQISTREAWVGASIVVQIQIINARDYKLPESFEIDGCDIRSAGTPSQSSRISIFNGRRTESRSVTAQFLVTPKREGQFQIPAIEIEVDGETKKTQSFSFVATKSETGDLLFAEVEGKQESVFVGEPLDLKLKIWIKPFADQENRIILNESQMWQMLSGQTAWGSFEDRIRELDENRHRPSGETVLRADGEGREGEYYLYEIDATVYPTKTGKINASDLQVVVNYPIALGRSRDPFDGLFGGRRLTVSESRPITAEAKVNSTSVLPVPTANQPADYRGAVGRYKIITVADPKSVASGDPLTLKIGIVGDGPMELVQAPPLHEIDAVTSDFQVDDQSLAGFVQDDTKVFVTTIRPRNEDVTQIPAIPFSFFNPEKEEFETVYSEPINVSVEKSEALGLDAIVSGSNASPTSGSRQVPLQEDGIEANPIDLNNEFSTSVLLNETPPSRSWWWYFLIVPPLAWLAVIGTRLAGSIVVAAGALRSPSKVAIAKTESAKDGGQVVKALMGFVGAKTKSACPTIQHAVGGIRNLGAYEEAASLESLFNKLDQLGRESTFEQADVALVDLKEEAVAVIRRLDKSLDGARRRLRKTSRKSGPRQNLTASMIGFILFSLATTCLADSQEFEQLETALSEANQSYQAATKLMESEPARAKEAFATAANGYQSLVDQGVRNSDLFYNLGNAWHLSGHPAHAILNYRRALWINPSHAKAKQSLAAIELELEQKNAGDDVSVSEGSFELNFANWRVVKTNLERWIEHSWLQVAFAASAVVFWLIVGIKTFRRRSPVLRWLVIPGLLMVVSGWALYGLGSAEAIAVIVSDSIELKRGDGFEFATEAVMDSVAGQTVEVIARRASWLNVRLNEQAEGWLPSQDVELVCIELSDL